MYKFGYTLETPCEYAFRRNWGKDLILCSLDLLSGQSRCDCFSGWADFKRHVYTNTDDPDPDTGYNFGKIRESRKIIAWGGTPQNSPRRVWFHDLSAGPESNAANYDIVTKDLDGNGRLDYRMPPIWEYGSVTGYRPFNDLSGDLAKILRYVALNLLFTSSPLYDPALSAPKLPSSIEVDINVYQADPSVNGLVFLKLQLVSQKRVELPTWITWIFRTLSGSSIVIISRRVRLRSSLTLPMAIVTCLK